MRRRIKRGRLVLPGRGLSAREFARKLGKRLIDNAVTDRGAQLAYYFLFALFPFTLLLVTLAAYLPVRGATQLLIDRAASFMPQQALAIVADHLHDLVSQPRPHLFVVSLLLALWSASRGVDALRGALNLSYDVRESRPFWRTQLVAFGTTVAASVLMLSSVAGIALGGEAGAWVARHLGLSPVWTATWALLRWPVTALLIMGAAALLYYFLPDVEQEFRFITPGACVGTLLWLLATFGFNQYAKHFGNYNATYGSIGGVILLLTWLYLTGLSFILGGEINALLEDAAPEGKATGARAAGEAPAPAALRPSIASPGAVKDRAAAERSEERLTKHLPVDALSDGGSGLPH